MPEHRVTLEAFGDAAWRVRLPGGVDARALLETLRALPGVVDAVVTEQHAVVSFDRCSPPQGVAAAVERASSQPGAAIAAREHVVGVRYDGEDLDEVARVTGLSPEQVAELHAGGTYVVACIGFLPGFAYLRGLDPRLVVARRATPRPRIAALSVGVAGPYTGIYPFASPGWWSLIGTAVGFAPFDARTGAALALGDRVRFRRVSP